MCVCLFLLPLLPTGEQWEPEAGVKAQHHGLQANSVCWPVFLSTPPLFYQQVNSANLKLVLKPNITDRKWKVIFEPQRGDIRFLTRKIPIMGLLNLQVCSAVQGGTVRYCMQFGAVRCSDRVEVETHYSPHFIPFLPPHPHSPFPPISTPTFSFPTPLLSPHPSPTLPQVGIGHDFKHNATGWKWKLTSALNGNTPSEIRYKHNLPVCPGVDVRVGWNAEYVLPDMHGALGTGEPILGLNVGRLYASVERLEAIFTSID
ncbi:unnamed protein product [Closterium sp. NIES-53]